MFSDREEGEIDSEEDCLRRRISELEAENVKYEKMGISGGYNFGCSNDLYTYENFNTWELQRAGRVPTDVSSISSVEFPSPKKRKRKRSKKDNCKHHHQSRYKRNKALRSNCQRHNSSRYVLGSANNYEIETILLDSSESGEYDKDNYSIATMDLESEEDKNDIALPLSREELRLALSHSTNDDVKINICPLKERLRKEKMNVKNNGDDIQICEDSIKNKSVLSSDKILPEIISDNSMSLEEQELRLIALRSAIVKKHLTRKKRNAEVAYSPTDFDQLVDPISSIETDLEELEKDIDISPVSSPNLSLSPIQYEEDHISIVSLDSLVNQNNKPIDMDIATSESDYEENALTRFDYEKKLLQHHDIPLPPEPVLGGSNISMVYNYTNHSTPMHLEIGTSAVNLKSRTELHSPSLPATQTHSLQLNDPPEEEYSKEQRQIMSDGVFPFEDKKLEEVTSTPYTFTNTELPRQNLEVSEQSRSEVDQGSDEEEKALRALLLSQHQNVKSSRQVSHVRYPARNYSPKITVDFKRSEKIQEFHKAPTFKSTSNSTPTESILKEAVRRLKVSTATSNNLNVKQPQIDENYCSNENVLAEEQKYYHKSADKEKSNTQILTVKKLDLNCDKSIIEKGNNDKQFMKMNYEPHIKSSCMKNVAESSTAREFKSIKNDLLISNNPNNSQEVNNVNISKRLKINTENMSMEKKEIGNTSSAYILKPQMCHANSEIKNIKTNTNPSSTRTKLNAIIKLPYLQKDMNPSSNAIDLLKVEKHITRPVKIIKPNKIINTNIELKRQVLLNTTPFVRKSDLLGHKSNVIHGSRLINSKNLLDVKVNKLIISLNDSETSNDEETLNNENLEKSIHKVVERTDTPDSLLTVLSENFYNITDTSNPPTESNCESRVEINQVLIPSKKGYEIKDSFEKKLDIFLKTVRSTVQQKNTTQHHKIRRTSGCNETTPTAVRSLPISSQEEYKRLIHRMKLLEKQKQLRKLHKGNNIDIKINTTSLKDTKEQRNAMCKTTPPRSIIQDQAESGLSTNKTCSNTDVASKEQELLTSEASLFNISNCIILNLDKSFQLVSEAKRAKIAKLRCVQKLKELRLEIDDTQRKLREQQEKISIIYPQICSTNELITKLKQKSAHMCESTLKLGKRFKGDEYRLNNDLKKEITRKTKGLATNIQLVNSIKYCDLDIFEKESKVCINKCCDMHKCNQLGNSGYSNTNDPKVANHAIEKQESNDLCDSKNIPGCGRKSQNDAKNSENIVDNTESMSHLDVRNGKDDESENSNKMDKEDCKEPKFIEYSGQSEVFEEGKSLCKYVSPLIHLRTESGRWDPNGIVCPYELMGQCEDKDCNYLHFCGKNLSHHEILK